MVGLPEKQIVSHCKLLTLVSILWLHSFPALLLPPRAGESLVGAVEAHSHSLGSAISLSCADIRIAEPNKNSAFSWKEKEMLTKKLSYSLQELPCPGDPKSRCRATSRAVCSTQPLLGESERIWEPPCSLLSLSPAPTGQGRNAEAEGEDDGWEAAKGSSGQCHKAPSPLTCRVKHSSIYRPGTAAAPRSVLLCCSQFAFEAVHQPLQHRRFAFFTTFNHYVEARRRESWGMS